jgi:hypothetical protein
LFLFLTALVLRIKYVKNNSNLLAVNERKAVKLAKKQLILAEKQLKLNNKDAFYTEILLALNNYLNNKLGIKIAENTRENIKQTLLIKKVDETKIITLLQIIDTCEFAKYAPGTVSGELNKVYGNTIQLITAIEEQLNKKG